MNKAAFLDRDGTLIYDVGYLSDPEQVTLLPGVVAGLKWLQSHGYLLVVVTNQSGIGRGLITEADYIQVTQRMLSLLYGHGVSITRVLHCPHTPEDDCNCRKPRLALFEQAATEHDIDLTSSVMFGDKETDDIPGLLVNFCIPKNGSWAAWWPAGSQWRAGG